MKLLLIVALCATVASAQWWGGWKDWISKHWQKNYNLDYIHNYRFEEHVRQGQKLVIAISDEKKDKTCHVISIDDEFEKHLTNQDDMEKITEEIFDLIRHHEANETSVSYAEAKKQFSDTRLIQECWNHDIYVMEYVPSFE